MKTWNYASGCMEEVEDGEYVHYEDHIKVVDSYIVEIASLKAELATLMSSLETWDEEFK